MGTDNLFHKRKLKVADNLRRKVAKRAPYDKILIVCEGEKTEPNYFNEIIQFHKLNTANVEVDGSCGSSPKSVFLRALELWRIAERTGDAFDRVYCVFDKDSHETYNETLDRIYQQTPKGVFFATVSVPCFEYWLLLHYTYSTKPYSATGNSSVANEVLKDLIGYMPQYAKGSQNIYSTLYDQVEFAKTNSERSLLVSQENHTDNPSTKVHQLVNYLQKLIE